MVRANTAAAMMGVSTREIYSQIDAGGIHFVKLAGQEFVCLQSLRKLFEIQIELIDRCQ